MQPRLCVFDDLVSDSFLHEVDLALSDELHVSVGQRNQQLLVLLAPMDPANRQVGRLLRGREHQEWV